MDSRTFHLPILLLAWILAVPVAGRAQADDSSRVADSAGVARPIADSTAAEGFPRRYIDAASRRSNPVLLHDWPALTRLLVWTRTLEAAIAGEDETVSADLIEGFRARVDSLAERPIPAFLAARSDSVKARIAAIGERIDGAEAALSAAPPEVRATGGAGENAPERQRTLVTGRTAVTVPAGVAVGDRDTLPKAAIEGGEPVNFLDHLALALSELDGLVHLVRTAGSPVSGSRSP